MEEIDENTSMEDLQKMMVVALVYRVLVCVYEVGRSTISAGRDVKTTEKKITPENVWLCVLVDTLF